MERRHLASLVDDFERAGNNIAIVSPRGLRERKISYRELAQLSRRFAAELVKRDIQKGDRVLIWGENSAEWVAAFFGCVLRGVLAVPLDPAGTLEFAQRVEADVSPKLMLGDSDKIRELGIKGRRLALSDFDAAITAETAGAVESLNENDALQIVFTSGTTGTPKGIVHTHKNVLASLVPIEKEAQKYKKYERIFHPVRLLHTLPLSHVFGQFMGLWIPSIFAIEVHFEPKLLASEIVDRIHRERISGLAAVPRVLDLLETYVRDRFPGVASHAIDGNRVSVLRRFWRFRKIHRLFGWKFWAFISGGASLPHAAEQFWTDMGFAVIQGYGMTETTALVSLNHPFHPAKGTVGKVLPGREVRLSDEGEVLVRGDTIASRTWQAGKLREQESEWLPTGDLAEFDGQGNLRFRGRKKDVIVTSSGLNIYPEDLEAALVHQAGVRAAAVIESNTDRGPEPVAVLAMNGDADASDAVSAANNELAEFQHVNRWIVWPEPDLPRTSTGKVLRREIVRRVATGELAPATAGLDSDLSLDSLGRVELQARLEQQFGVSLDDAALQQAKTGDEIRRLIAQTRTGAPARGGEASEHIYPHWPWNPIMRAVRVVFLELIGMPLLRFLAGRPAVKREQNAWPESRLLIVSNHVTAYDPAFVLYALPRPIRHDVAIAMAGEMLLDFRRMRNQANWFVNLVAPIGYLLVTALFNVFPLPQHSGFRRSFAHAGEAMDRGYHVLVFPEGQRSDDENALPFKRGAGLLWKELGAPALPVRLRGLGELKARHARWFRSGRVSVSVGKIIPAQPDKSPEELTEILRQGVFGQ